jgi:SAM-dependent methyltransferase
MKVFELIKTILDDTYSKLPEPRDTTLAQRMEKLTNTYRDLTTNDPPDYADPVTRFAYVYKYTTCHACIVAKKIQAVPELRQMFVVNRDTWTKVACVGGGPGSDYLGVVKHKMLHQPCGNLKCFLLDREQAWGDTWADVDERAEGLGFRISTHFQALDIADENTWRHQTRYLEADLFTFIYFISEVYKRTFETERYLNNIFSAAKPGALFLFIDNDKPFYCEPFDAVARKHLEYLCGGSERYVADASEQKTDLDPYFTTFSGYRHQPKLTAYIAWRVYRKPLGAPTAF